VEPFGRVLLEAWLAKTPVVATSVGRISKIITNNRDAMLVEHGDEQAMCNAVIKLFRDKKFSSDLAIEGRKTVETRFSIKRCTEKLEGIYKELLAPTVNNHP